MISEQKETFSASLSKNEYSTSEDDENDDGQIRQEDVDDSCFTELVRGNNTRKQFFNQILDVVALLGGDVRDVR